MPSPITTPAARMPVSSATPAMPAPRLSKGPAMTAPMLSKGPVMPVSAPVKTPLAAKQIPGQVGAPVTKSPISSINKTAALRLILQGMHKEAADRAMIKSANCAKLRVMLKQASVEKRALIPALLGGAAAGAIGIPMLKSLYHAVSDNPYGVPRQTAQDRLFQQHLRNEALRTGKQRNDLANIRNIYAPEQKIPAGM